jgi:hypothetical protein
MTFLAPHLNKHLSPTYIAQTVIILNKASKKIISGPCDRQAIYIQTPGVFQTLDTLNQFQFLQMLPQAHTPRAAR